MAYFLHSETIYYVNKNQTDLNANLELWIIKNFIFSYRTSKSDLST